MKNLIEAAQSAVNDRILALTQHIKCWRVVVSTQVWENYGAHDWDGKGECPQYWKAKGGRDITIGTFSAEPEYSRAQAMAAQWSSPSSDYSREDMINWTLLAPGRLTSEEQDQLAWDPILCKLNEMVDDARRIAAQAEWEQTQQDLMEEEAHRFGTARP